MKKANSSHSPFLPEEIITDILTRLPVRSLIRFRSVSKSWLNLISNRYFINTQLVRSSKSFTFENHKIILWHKSSGSYYLKSCSLHSLFSPRSDHANFGNGHSLQLDYKLNQIVGSCNGLVCILMGKIRKSFLIWNPSTGESNKLSILEESLQYSTFGFGYNQLNDDYKVVEMKIDSSSRRKVVKLYSLRNNSWKKIGDFPNGVASSKSQFVNGALHWKFWDPSRSLTHTSFVILSFDLGNETYSEIAEPDYGGGNCSSSLIVLEGCISLCYNFKAIGADIWVMKEYGLRDSWVKLFTVPYFRIPQRIAYSQSVLFYDSLMGEILLKQDEMLRIYYPKYGTFTSKSIENIMRASEGAITYLESLVSP